MIKMVKPASAGWSWICKCPHTGTLSSKHFTCPFEAQKGPQGTVDACAKCGAPATRTQRLLKGKPVAFEQPIVLIGDDDHYEPRCRHCHEIPNKPQKF